MNPVLEDRRQLLVPPLVVVAKVRVIDESQLPITGISQIGEEAQEGGFRLASVDAIGPLFADFQVNLCFDVHAGIPE